MEVVERIVLIPHLPLPILGLLLAAAALLLAFALWRRMPRLLWRLGALALLLLVLANPVAVTETREGLRDVAVVVVDRSASQEVGARQAQVDLAIEQLRKKLGRLAGLDIRIIETSAEAPGPRGRDGTHLIAALRRALANVPQRRLAGVILLSDGQVHDLPANITALLPPAPVHLLLSGKRQERDRRLEVMQAPSYGIVGEDLSLMVRVSQTGVTGKKGGLVSILVRQDGKFLRREQVQMDQTWRIPITLKHGGQTIVELQVDGVPNELSLRNNGAILAINGVRDRLRVLLISGEPHAGERTWRNILKSDPGVDLVHFTILRPPEKNFPTPIRELALISFPTRQLFQDRLKGFDLIIFDRFRRRGVLPLHYFRNVVDYANQGGAILVAAGPDFAGIWSLFSTPLGKVLPAAPTGKILMQGYKPRLSKIGRRHPITATLSGGAGKEPTWGRWFRLIETENSQGQTLLQTAAGKPVLVVARSGEGRVAQLLSDHVWLWSRGFEGGGPQAELLRRIAHWLMKEPELEEEDLRAREQRGKLLIERRSLKAGGGVVKVTVPSGETVSVKLRDAGGGRETGILATKQSGMYRLDDGARQAVAAVGVLNPREFADLRATGAILQPLISASRGAVFYLEDGLPSPRRVGASGRLSGHGWFGLVRREDYRVTGVTQRSLLPGFLALAILLLLFAAAWRREGG